MTQVGFIPRESFSSLLRRVIAFNGSFKRESSDFNSNFTAKKKTSLFAREKHLPVAVINVHIFSLIQTEKRLKGAVLRVFM